MAFRGDGDETGWLVVVNVATTTGLAGAKLEVLLLPVVLVVLVASVTVVEAGEDACSDGL